MTRILHLLRAARTEFGTANILADAVAFALCGAVLAVVYVVLP